MPFGKQVTLIIWFVGISVLVGLTIWSGADLVGQAIVSTGWAAALVVMVRMTGVAGAATGWWLLFPKDIRPPLAMCILLRVIRESTNALLPLAQIGGDFIGARCLALHGTKGTVAAASVIVDVLIQAATQLTFALVGVVLLLVIGGGDLIAWSVAVGIVLAMPALVAFYVVQGTNGQRLVKKLLTFVAGDREWHAFGTIDDLFAQLDMFHSDIGRLARSFFWHLADWFVGTAEVYIVFSFMGYPVAIEQALIIESLMQAVRGAAFVVPGAFGVQEGGLVVLCAIFGIPPEAALALSLVKRIPDIIIGVPGLVAWQVMEGRRFHLMRARHNGRKSEGA
jgi:putative membrane protein